MIDLLNCNTKAKHSSENDGLVYAGLYLLPADEFFRMLKIRGTLCAFAGICKETCLIHSGHGGIRRAVNTTTEIESYLPKEHRDYGRTFENAVIRAAFARTALYWFHREFFLRLLWFELVALPPARVRLNGTSDIDWDKEGLRIETAPLSHIQFYDYTKDPARALGYAGSAYKLAYSISEKTNPARLRDLLKYGVPIAVTVDTAIQATAIVQRGTVRFFSDENPADNPDWYIRKAVSGDVSDGWIIDERNAVGVLRPKGELRDNPNGFSTAWERFMEAV